MTATNFVFGENYSKISDQSDYFYLPPYQGITAIQISNDGSKMYLNRINSGFIHQYTLSTPFQLSTAIFEKLGNFYSNDITHIIISPDGTKFFTINLSKTKLRRFDLTTPYDVSTGVFFQEVNYLSNDNSLNITSNGLYLYNYKLRYSLTTPFDLNTATVDYSGAQEGTVTNDGKYLFRLEGSNPDVYVVSYTLTTLFDTRTAVLYQSLKVSSTIFDKSFSQLTIKTDGLKIFINSYIGGGLIIGIKLPSPYKLY